MQFTSDLFFFIHSGIIDSGGKIRTWIFQFSFFRYSNRPAPKTGNGVGRDRLWFICLTTLYIYINCVCEYNPKIEGQYVWIFVSLWKIRREKCITRRGRWGRIYSDVRGKGWRGGCWQSFCSCFFLIPQILCIDFNFHSNFFNSIVLQSELDWRGVMALWNLHRSPAKSKQRIN